MPNIEEQELIAKARERIYQPLYDTTEFDTGSQTMFFFQEVQGGRLPISGTQKTLVHTNMVSQGQVPAKEHFLLQAIGLHIPLPKADIGVFPPDYFIELFDYSYLELIVQNKIYYQIISRLCPSASGYWSDVQFDAQVSPVEFANITLGSPDARSIAAFPIPIMINSQEPFQIKQVLEDPFPAGLNFPGRVVCTLYGILRRPVQ